MLAAERVVFFVATVIGIPLIPFWLIFGPAYCSKKFESSQSVLTEKVLTVCGGVLIKVEETIPLDRIQDLTLTEDPFLKAFGLCSIRAETAGAVTTAGGGGAGLVGVVDARKFRNAVLDQRELVTSGGSSLPVEMAEAGEKAVLEEIRDALLRIEGKMKS